MGFADLAPIPIGVGDYVLRQPCLDDVCDITAAVSDYEVSKMLARVPYPYGPESAAGWVEITRARFANGTGFGWIIAGDTKLAGIVAISPFSKQGELGYWLRREAQGCGLMTAAARAALGFAFTHGAETILSGAFDDNPASLRVQHNVGFESVGESAVYSLSRKAKLRHIDTRLTRDDFLKRSDVR